MTDYDTFREFPELPDDEDIANDPLLQSIGAWMTDFEARRLAETDGKPFLLTAQARNKLAEIESLCRGNYELSTRFDPVWNRLELTLRSYVIDSMTGDPRRILALTDVFDIEAKNDGQVEISMAINNASETL